MKVSFKALLQGNYYLLKRGAGGKVIIVTLLGFILFTIVAIRSCMTMPSDNEIYKTLGELDKMQEEDITIDINDMFVEKKYAYAVTEAVDAVGLDSSGLHEIPSVSYTFAEDAVAAYCKNCRLFPLVKQKEDNVTDAIKINHYLSMVIRIILAIFIVYRILLFFIANMLTDKSMTFEEIKNNRPVLSYIFSFIIPLLGPLVLYILLLIRVALF